MTTFRSILLDIGVEENLVFLLPFLLVFTLVFAVLERTKILGTAKKNNKDVPKTNLNTVVALVMGLAFVIPSITGQYGRNDPVEILMGALPGTAMVVLAIVMALILIGAFGKPFKIGRGESLKGVVVAASAIIVAGIFAISAGIFQNVPYWLQPLMNSYNQTLIVSLLVLGAIIWFITRDTEPNKPKKDRLSPLAKFLGYTENDSSSSSSSSEEGEV